MDLIGATYVRDVEPGEVLVITADGMRSIKPFPPAPLAHCVFEHVYFARPDSYVFGKSVNEVRTELGRDSRARAAGRRRRRRAGARLGRLRGDGLCRGVGRSAADGAHPQSLRRPHVHPAAAVDPAFRRQGEAESGPEHPRRQARHSRRRLDRARHDEPEDRQDGAGGGREGSARADQLSADDLAVLLRRRHAAQVGADRARRTRSRRSASSSRPTASPT